MKIENQLRLARIAHNDCWFGGARALVLAERITAITGSDEAETIVNRVYTHPQGKATYECPECGGEYVDPDAAHQCCAPCDEYDEDYVGTFCPDTALVTHDHEDGGPNQNLNCFI